MTQSNAIRGVLAGLKKHEPKREKGVGRHTNLNDVFGGDASEHSVLPPKSYYYVVHIYDEPVSMETIRSFDPNIRATKSLYTIQYIAKSNPYRNGKFCYLIGQDLVRLRVLVSGFAHWQALSRRIPELGWIDRNTTLSADLFGIAKRHPGTIFRFGIKFVEYGHKIMKKAEQEGIDIDNKPFVTYAYSQDVYEKYKDKKFAPIRTKQDYLDEIEAAKLETEKEDEE